MFPTLTSPVTIKCQCLGRPHCSISKPISLKPDRQHTTIQTFCNDDPLCYPQPLLPALMAAAGPFNPQMCLEPVTSVVPQRRRQGKEQWVITLPQSPGTRNKTDTLTQSCPIRAGSPWKANFTCPLVPNDLLCNRKDKIIVLYVFIYLLFIFAINKLLVYFILTGLLTFN